MSQRTRPTRPLVSHRVRLGAPNPIARRRAEFLAAGVELTDMTDTNPTRHGLLNPAILDILADSVARAGRYDPTPRGPWPARAALAERFGGDPEDYWLTASTSEAYSWIFSILADGPDTILTPAPGYPLIEPLARLHGLFTQNYRTFYVHPSGWELDLDSLNLALGSQRSDGNGTAPPAHIRAVVTVNPNNPTGDHTDPALPDLVASHGLPLIADEVFYPFWLGVTATSAGNVAAATPERTPPSRLSGYDHTLTFSLDGLSKLLAAPQFKLGWIRLSGPRDDVRLAADALDQVADTFLSVNSPVALALPDLLDLADSSVARIIDRLRVNLACAREVFSNLRVRTVYGGWMIILDIPPLAEADHLVMALMERAGIYVHPGYFYDLPDSTLAISLLPDVDVFRESCLRLSAALDLLAGVELPLTIR